MPSIRTFIAVEVGSQVCKRAADLMDRLRVSGAPVKWASAANLHITLKFLGNVSTDEISDMCRMVEDLVTDVPPFALHCRGAGAFPRIERPRVVWLGIEQGSEQLIALQKRIDEAMMDLGFRPEVREFHPHITLGRVRRGDRTLEQLSDLIQQNDSFDAGSFDVNEVCVFSSSLKRQGPEYTPLARAELG